MVIKWIMLLFLLQFAVFAQWQRTNGPEGGRIEVLSVRNDTLYAGSDGGGIFFSIDNSAHWDLVNSDFTSAFVYALAVKGDTLFAGTTRGIYFTTNNGTEWSNIKFDSARNVVTSIAINGNTVYAGSSDDMYISTDNGANWSLCSEGLPDTYTKAIIVKNETVFAGTLGGLFRSRDKGATWTKIDSGFASQFIQSLAINGATMYAGTAGGLYRSPDTGTTWEAVAEFEGTSVVSLASCGDTICAGTYSDGLFISLDNGMTWSFSSFVNREVISIAITQGTILATVGHSGIYQSADGGLSWTVRNKGLVSSAVIGLENYNNTLFAGTARGLFSSSDGGQKWTAEGIGISVLSEFYVFPIFKDKGSLFCGVDRGIASSHDNGENWDLDTICNSGQRATAFAKHNSFLFASTSTSNGNIFISRDSGKSWDSLKILELEEFDNVTSFASIDDDFFIGTSGKGIFRSSDIGVTWDTADSGIPTPLIRMLSATDTTLFAVTNNGIYISTNRGVSWRSANNDEFTDLAITSFIIKDGVLFAGTDRGGIFLSADTGRSWRSVSDGLHGNYINAITALDGYLYIGTSGCGVWRRPLSEMIPSTGNKLQWSSADQLQYRINLLKHSGSVLTIKLTTSHSGHVAMTIYDLSGRKVASIVNKYLQMGNYHFTWNTRAHSSGCYAVRIQIETNVFDEIIQVVK